MLVLVSWGHGQRCQLHWRYFQSARKAFPLGSARMITPQQAMLMPMTICVIVPGLGAYPSFMGFRATQYTYPPAPISPDPESTRQLQQLLSRGASAGEVGAPGAARGRGSAELVTSGGAATLMGSRGWDKKEPIFKNSVSTAGVFGPN